MAVPRIAVVDIGSNSTTIAVIVVGADGVPHREFRRSVPNRLFRCLVKGHLPRRSVDSLVEDVRSLTADVARFGPDRVVAVATSAIRDADNRDEVVERLTRVVPTRLLDGEEEGRLAARAVLATLPVRDAMVYDQGGGSLQWIRIVDGQIGSVASDPLGVVRLTDAHARGDPPDTLARTALRKLVAARLAKVRQVPGPLIGVGGSVRSLAKVLRRSMGWPLDHGHGLLLARDRLQALCDTVWRSPVADLRKMPGVAEHRADTLAVAVLTATTVVASWNATGLRVCGAGLREGVALAELEPSVPRDLLGASLGGLFPDVSGRGTGALARGRALAEALGVDADATAIASWVWAVGALDARKRLRETWVGGCWPESVVLAHEAFGDVLADGARRVAAVAEAAATHADCAGAVWREDENLWVPGPVPKVAGTVEALFGVRWRQG